VADDYKVLITGVVTVGIAVTAYVLYQAPLKSMRPLPGAEADLPSHLVTARLWEDPLEAAESHAKGKRQADVELLVTAGDGGRLAGKIKMTHDDPPHHQIGDVWKEEAASKQTSVLLVMTDGSPYPEGHEVRLNNRYAVVSALHVGCYVPKGDLQYFQWTEGQPVPGAGAASSSPTEGEAASTGTRKPPGKTGQSPSSERKQWNVPYEWYEYEARPTVQCSRMDVPQHVLVLWVNNEAVLRQPLRGLADLTQSLCAASGSSGCRHVDFKIIGPPDSDTFRTMIHEVIEKASIGRRLAWPNARYIELFSPWVTAADQLVLEELKLPQSQQFDLLHRFLSDPEVKAQNVLSLVFSMASVDIQYRITQDDTLFMELMKELDRRNVKPAHDSIALIGELDSFYARAFSKEFLAAACAWEYFYQIRLSSRPRVVRWFDRLLRTPDPPLPCHEELAARFPTRQLPEPPEVLAEALKHEHAMNNIRRYSYLRGLDGLVVYTAAGEAKKGPEKKGDDTGKSRERLLSAENLERPEGESQFDYLRRLVARIKKDEQRMGGDKAPRRNMKAIGILGTDIYDRLLILQALRKEFPGVVFFMTDLDARLFQNNQYDWTRNVVVPSAFGLELEKELQRDIPPFRSSYQTSAFLAVLQSVRHVEKRINDCRKRDCREAYVYRAAERSYSTEITPRLFEVGRRGPVDISTNPPQPELASIHPPVPPRTPEIGWLGPWYVGFSKTIIVLTVVALAFVFLTIPAARAFIGRHPAFSLRLLAVAIAITVFESWLVRYNEEPFSLLDGVSTWPAIGIRTLAALLSWYFLAESWKALEESDADLPTRYPALRRMPTTKMSLRSLRDTFRWLSRNPAELLKATTWDEVQTVWRDYQEAGTRAHRRWRVAIMIVMYFVFTMLLFMLMFGGASPWVPCRGSVNCGAEFIILAVAAVLLLFINLFVFDATRLCKAFVDRLIEKPSERTQHLHAAHYKQLIQLIADRTKAVGPLVYYPFIVLSLMIVSRSRYFDDWDFPAWLIVIWLINAALVFWSAYTLKRAADQARDRAIKNLEGLVGPQIGSVDQIRVIKEEIKGTREGSFDHILQQPAVSASLLAVLAALQYYFST
jgi:hypothetical protein